MSLKPRRLSLDSSMDEGLLVRRGNMKLSKKSRQSLDEGRLDFQELSNKLQPLRPETITEEKLERSDGVIKANSFVKQNRTFHKLFPETPEEEKVTHTFACALQKEVLYHGKLYVSERHVCFHSSVLLKDTKVVIPASCILAVKKHYSDLFRLTLKTTDGEKHSLASLRYRDMCYRLLRGLCSNTQESSANSSPRLSAAEIDLEHDWVRRVGEADGRLLQPCVFHQQLPSCSSLEDTVETSRQSSFSLDEGSPPLTRDGPSRFSPAVSPTDENHRGGSPSALSWIIQAPFFFLRSSDNVATLFAIYLLLTVLLLLASGYMGMRITALEEQLNTLGALTELMLPHRE